MERDGFRHVTLPKTRNMRTKTTQRFIPDRSSPGPRTAPSVGRTHQDGDGNCATGGSSKIIRVRNKIVIAAPFNITIIQAYAPTTDHEDEEVEDFYNEVQRTLRRRKTS
ncbi:craniofacial development protein 2-like [Elysia marginata]|uniref:Craniofacial development protein 2-like n=1 Tax=Elysia marginata TaxID=1093978 RepID=A0AAV4J017_9GAST|nr:craniofacial development protein 2-like [Elysia marginata]